MSSVELFYEWRDKTSKRAKRCWNNVVDPRAWALAWRAFLNYYREEIVVVVERIALQKDMTELLTGTKLLCENLESVDGHYDSHLFIRKRVHHRHEESSVRSGNHQDRNLRLVNQLVVRRHCVNLMLVIVHRGTDGEETEGGRVKFCNGTKKFEGFSFPSHQF